MHKILFPTDFSEPANHAFIYALKMADKIGATITTLHVYDIPDIHVDGVLKEDALQKIYDSIDLGEFENYRDSIPALRAIAEKEGLGNIDMYHVMEHGAALPKIVEYSGKGYDMIVMGTKGAGWLKGILIGSVAGEVMEHSKVPVLAIPQKAHFDGRINNIAVSTEYKEEEKELLRRVIAFASLFKAHVYCIHVDQVHTEDLTHRMDAFRKDFEHVNRLHFKVIEGFNISESLSEYVNKFRMDMICMLTHKRNFWQELFNYSIAKVMSYHTNTPILSFPAAMMHDVVKGGKKQSLESNNT